MMRRYILRLTAFLLCVSIVLDPNLASAASPKSDGFLKVGATISLEQAVNAELTDFLTTLTTPTPRLHMLHILPPFATGQFGFQPHLWMLAIPLLLFAWILFSLVRWLSGGINLKSRPSNLSYLAHSQILEGNSDNWRLWRDATSEIEPRDVAVDVGYWGSEPTTWGLSVTGFASITRVDNDALRSKHQMGHLNREINHTLGDPTSTHIASDTADVATYNQILDASNRDNPWQYREIALFEALRILKPAGWILIKTGNSTLGTIDLRTEEAHDLVNRMTRLGFKSIRVEIWRNEAGDEIPVFISARKPLPEFQRSNGPTISGGHRSSLFRHLAFFAA